LAYTRKAPSLPDRQHLRQRSPRDRPILRRTR
jgi:hypothetical protein